MLSFLNWYLNMNDVICNMLHRDYHKGCVVLVNVLQPVCTLLRF